MYELPKRVYINIFPDERYRCLSSSSVLGAGSLYVVSSTIIQMVYRVFRSRELAAGRPIVVLWYKVYKFFWCHACMKFAPPFFSSRLSNVCWSNISHTVVLKTLILLS